jgi:putative Holliday junction resolvase
MAVDYGRKRVGIAVTDPQCTISQPLSTLKVTSRRQIVQRLSGLIEELDIDRVIVGYPCSLNGVPTEMAHEIERFIRQLKKRVKINIVLWDERLTSKYAHTTLKAMGIRRHKDTVDQVAACIMLDEYLKKKCQIS